MNSTTGHPSGVGRSARAFCPAKLNLNLAALGLREDGFRELETDMLLLDFGDDLLATQSDTGEVRLDLSGPAVTEDIPLDERNLAVRAALHALAAARVLGIDAGLDLQLFKRIPSGAGLGGGSSNAAGALRASLAALGLQNEASLGAQWRRGVLAELGSDTVFFDAARQSGHARCTGRGERVEPLQPLPDAVFQLATPIEHAPTGGVYAELGRQRGERGSASPIVEHRGVAIQRGTASLANDLAPAAFALAPGLGELQTALGAEWQLTGSGSTFFKRTAGDAAERDLRAWRLWTLARPWRPEGEAS